MSRFRPSSNLPAVLSADATKAEPLGEALVRGGLPVAEVMCRTAAAMETIAALAARGDVLVGAGTVLTPAQADEAVDAGASFVVTPGIDADVIARCQERGVEVLPGAVTATEIMAARRLGLRTVKFFPAWMYGGPAGVAAMATPFDDVSFVPTGGVGSENLPEYLSLPCVAAVGGTWTVPADAIDSGDVDRIAALCAAAVAAVQRIDRT